MSLLRHSGVDDERAELLASVGLAILVGLQQLQGGADKIPDAMHLYQSLVLAAIPPDNLAARIIAGNGAGLTASPDDEQGFLAAADRLSADAAARGEMARKALDYARRTFDIAAITARFEEVLARVATDGKP